MSLVRIINTTIRLYKYKFIIVLLSIVVFQTSCSRKIAQKNPESLTWESPLNNMLRKPMIKAIITDSLEATLPFQLTDNDGNELHKANFIIDQKDSSIYLKSDSNGIVMVTLNQGILKKNPIIKIQYRDLKAKNINCLVGGKTVVFRDGKSVDAEVIEFKNLNYLDSMGFKLYYTTDPIIARNYLDTFIIAYGSIKNIIGKKDMKQTVFPLLTTSQDISVIGEPQDVNILPVKKDSWYDKYWHFTHETVENNLINTKDVYGQNENLRFIGDGLAEYVSLKLLESESNKLKSKMLKSRIFSLEKATEQNLNLNKWGIEDERLEGYSYALAFWLKIEYNYGQQSIKDFIHKFSELKSFKNKDIKDLFISNFNEIKLKEKYISLSKTEALKILNNEF